MDRQHLRQRLLVAGALAAVIVVFVPSASQAYIDPGTGSYFFQIGVAFVLGGLFTLKLYWQRFRALIGKIFSRRRHDDPT